MNKAYDRPMKRQELVGEQRCAGGENLAKYRQTICNLCGKALYLVVGPKWQVWVHKWELESLVKD